jgi:hypothetical protein
MIKRRRCGDLNVIRLRHEINESVFLLAYLVESMHLRELREGKRRLLEGVSLSIPSSQHIFLSREGFFLSFI